ncbi:MAG TPA: polyprenol monophosphomannose synthase [Gaiellaceae bacterium]
MATTVVVPTYNEAESLPALVEALYALDLPDLRMLVVDDSSPDGTGRIAEELGERLRRSGEPFVRVLHRPQKQGLGRAYVAGMTRALEEGADFVVQMDADFSHEPTEIPKMLEAIERTGAGVVIGSRYVPGGSLDPDWTRARRLLSVWANLYARTILRMEVRDITAGFKLWRREALLAVDLAQITSDGYAFQIEMNWEVQRRGYEIVEIPIYFRERREGASKMSFHVQAEAAISPFQLLLRRR